MLEVFNSTVTTNFVQPHYLLSQNIGGQQKILSPSSKSLGTFPPEARSLSQDLDISMLKICMLDFQPPSSAQHTYVASSSSSVASLMRQHAVTSPRVVCHSQSAAERVAQQVNYAMTIASERSESLQFDPGEEEAEERAFELDVWEVLECWTTDLTCRFETLPVFMAWCRPRTRQQCVAGRWGDQAWSKLGRGLLVLLLTLGFWLFTS